MLGVLSPVPSLTLTRLVSSLEVGVWLANAYAKPCPPDSILGILHCNITENAYSIKLTIGGDPSLERLGPVSANWCLTLDLSAIL